MIWPSRLVRQTLMVVSRRVLEVYCYFTYCYEWCKICWCWCWTGLCSTHESWVKFDLTLTQMSRVRVQSAVKIKEMSRVRVESCLSPFESELSQLDTDWVKVESLIFLNPRPAGGGAKGPPYGFSHIAPEVLGISLWNLPYLSGQQFHTLCQKIRIQVIIGQPWVTSEWRHVSPILINKMGLRKSPPLVQF